MGRRWWCDMHAARVRQADAEPQFPPFTTRGRADLPLGKVCIARFMARLKHRPRYVAVRTLCQSLSTGNATRLGRRGAAHPRLRCDHVDAPLGGALACFDEWGDNAARGRGPMVSAAHVQMQLDIVALRV
jgi:hypothetical protein